MLSMWVLVLALWWIAGRIRGRFSYNPVLRNAWLALLCGLAWLVYVWLQLVPIPIGILELLSPQAAHWHIAAAAPDALAAAPLTLDRYATLEGACKSTAYVAYFVLSLILLKDRDRIRIAAYVLIASGLLQSMYLSLIHI